MTVTVAVRRRARPGQADTLLERTRRLLAPAVRLGTPRSARVFRARADARDFLLIGDWDSREAYWSSRDALGIAEQLDPLSEGAPEHYLFERLALFEDVVYPVAAVACALLTYPTGTAPGLNQALWWPAREQVRQQPGCVLHAVYRELDGADRLFAMSGWSSEQALERFLAELGPTLDAQQRAAGVRSDRFVGVTIVELTANGTR